MQNRTADRNVGRIYHSRFDGNAPETARAFVMQQLESLPEGCVLEIELDFDPAALLAELAERGAPAQIQKLAKRRFMLLLQPAGEPELVDLCDLEAPLPMERILEAVAELRPGEAMIARTPCFPRPLLAQLDLRNLDWQATEAADTSGLIWIGRPG